MFADIATGNTGAADVLFLIGAILAGLSAVFSLLIAKSWEAALVPAAICLIALAFLLV